MADEKCEKLRARAERRCDAEVQGLAADATRKSYRHKCHPWTDEQNTEKARVETERQSFFDSI